MAASMKISRLLTSYCKKSLTARALQCSCNIQRHYSAVAETKPRTWQLHSAVCLQRYPVITAELTEIEQKYKEYLSEVELDQSLLCDHELKAIDEENRLHQKEAAGSSDPKKKSSADILITISEKEYSWQKEADAFKLADRITDADRNNDMTSTDRKLDKRLVLITKQKWSDISKPVWNFPQILRVEGESMREAAERALKTHCGKSVNAKYMGNAPCGYHKYNLPSGFEEKGVKLFFFKANYKGGDVVLQDNVLEYKWVTIDELSDYFKPSYLDDISEFLFES